MSAAAAADVSNKKEADRERVKQDFKIQSVLKSVMEKSIANLGQIIAETKGDELEQMRESGMEFRRWMFAAAQSEQLCNTSQGHFLKDGKRGAFVDVAKKTNELFSNANCGAIFVLQSHLSQICMPHIREMMDSYNPETHFVYLFHLDEEHRPFLPEEKPIPCLCPMAFIYRGSLMSRDAHLSVPPEIKPKNRAMINSTNIPEALKMMKYAQTGEGKINAKCMNFKCDKKEDRANGLEFKVKCRCDTAVYCSIKCQMFHYGEEHKETCIAEPGNNCFNKPACRKRELNVYFKKCSRCKKVQWKHALDPALAFLNDLLFFVGQVLLCAMSKGSLGNSQVKMSIDGASTKT